MVVTHAELRPINFGGLCDGQLPQTVARGRWSELRGELSYSRATHPWPANEASKCLRNRTVLFLGDCNLRYQYLSLATLLHSGAFPSMPRLGSRAFSVCSEHTVVIPPQKTRSLSVEQQLQLFFDQSTASFGGDEVCECDKERRLENRFFLEKRRDEDGDGGARLMSFFLGDKHARRSAVSASTFARGFHGVRESVAARCGKGGCRNISENLESIDDVFEIRIRPLLKEGDTVVLGPGAWWHPKISEAHTLRAFMHRIKALVGPSGHAIYKSCVRGAVGRGLVPRETGGCSNDASCDDVWRTLINETGWALLDAWQVSDELWELIGESNGWKPKLNASQLNPYIDNFHLRCDVVTALNRLLLEQICTRDAPPASEISSRSHIQDPPGQERKHQAERLWPQQHSGGSPPKLRPHTTTAVD